MSFKLYSWNCCHIFQGQMSKIAFLSKTHWEVWQIAQFCCDDPTQFISESLESMWYTAGSKLATCSACWMPKFLLIKSYNIYIWEDVVLTVSDVLISIKFYLGPDQASNEMRSKRISVCRISSMMLIHNEVSVSITVVIQLAGWVSCPKVTLFKRMACIDWYRHLFQKGA